MAFSGFTCNECNNSGQNIQLVQLKTQYICVNCIKLLHQKTAHLTKSSSIANHILEHAKKEPETLADQLKVTNNVGRINNAASKQGNLAIRSSGVKEKKKTISSDPQKIKKYLDKHIIGQEKAKKILSVAVYNHYKRIEFYQRKSAANIKTIVMDNVSNNSLHSTTPPKQSEQSLDISIKPSIIDKSNILMIGSTGSGKTLIAKTIAKILDVPFTVADATGLVQSGYVGESVENCIQSLYRNSNFDIKATEKGIVFIDEIDKIAKKQEVSTGRDVAGEGVQQQLLKLIEGTEVKFLVENSSGNSTEVIIKTDNILFICGGAFVSKKPVVTTEDIIKFGMIPELVGRLPIVATLEDHTIESLFRILTEPQNSVVNQAIEMFACEGIKLNFTKNALEYIAQRAIDNNTGARGLKTILDKVLLEANFNIVSLPKELLITEQYVIDSLVLNNKI